MNLAPVRGLVARKLAAQVSKKAREAHYPAPYAIIRLWREHAGDERGMLLAEARSIAALMITPSSRNLVRVFMLQDRLKDMAKKSEREMRRVHVIGAGVMGGDIAAWCALKGFEVTLQDRDVSYVARAVDRGGALFERKLRDPEKAQAAVARLQSDVAGDGVADADIVIEAIFEDLDAKRSLYATLEPGHRFPQAVLGVELQVPSQVDHREQEVAQLVG